MSRAFVKEQDDADALEELAERPVSKEPNAVTPRGLRLIDEEIDKHRRELAHAQHVADRNLIARSSRDLRYWTQRRSTAQLIQPPRNPDKVAFGVKVTIEDRKSTRLNSSHRCISYAVFCLKKKKPQTNHRH